MKTLGLLVVAGGMSTRMGRDKASLPWRNGTLLSSLLARAARSYSFADIVLAVNQPIDITMLPGTVYGAVGDNGKNEFVDCLYPNKRGSSVFWQRPGIDEAIAIRAVSDAYKQCGPLAGLEAGLRVGSADYYVTVSVDMPFYVPEQALIERWQQLMAEGMEERPLVIMPRHSEGCIQPLAAIYDRRCASYARALLEDGDYRLRRLSEIGATVYVEASRDAHLYLNVNTPVAYKTACAYALNRTRRVPLITVTAARSKTGKTRVATGLIAALSARGVAVGLVKSDGHGFTMDRADSDTGKATAAGAAAVAISGPEGYAVLHHRKAAFSLEEMAQRLEVEAAILESRNHGAFPCIEVLRHGYADTVRCSDEVIAVVTDRPEAVDADQYKVFSFEAYEAMADWLLQYVL